MSRTIEAFRSARERINPEGLAFSTAVTFVSPAVLPAVSAGVTLAVHELAKETNPELMKILAIAVLGTLNALSVTAETKALKADNYSASPVSSSLHILTGKPLLSSLAGHALNYAHLSLLKPINWYAITTKNSELLIESEGSTTMMLTAWFTTLNALVLTGKTKPFVEKVKEVRLAIGNKFRRETKR